MYVIIASKDEEKFFICKGGVVRDHHSFLVSFKIEEIWCADDIEDLHIADYKEGSVFSVHFLNVFEERQTLGEIFK